MQVITVSELKEKLAKMELALVDVRTLEEYKEGHINGAFLLSLDSVSAENLPKTNLPIVLYCLFGKRSKTAYQKLLSQTSNLDLYYLEGGMSAWQEAGYEINRITSIIEESNK